jgi:hypothetical protein
MLPKKGSFLIAGLMLLSLAGQAQLTIQSGATFNMQAGAQVTVQGHVDNAGTLSNDGLLKVQGNYVNTGTYSGVTTNGVLEVYGTGNSNITPGGSAIPHLVVNKTAAADIVKLGASAIVSNSFTLTNGIFTTDPIANPSFNLSSPVTATYNFAAGKEIIGSVKRTGFTAGVPHIFNQPNMLVTTNGGSTPTDFTVTMIPESAGGDPTQAEREVKRKFSFAQTAGSGFTTDIRYPYLSSELNTNTEANLVPWRLAAAEWNARLTPVTRDLANDYVTTTGIAAADLVQEWKLADPNYTFNAVAYLRGGWNGSNAMNPTLNTSGYLPLTQPYSDPAFGYAGPESVAPGFFAANPNIVDWVLIDFRKPASGLPLDALSSTSIGKQAAFILNTGAIVDLNGTDPLSFDLNKQGAGFIVIKHRNHLAIMSNSLPSNALGTYTNDFSLLANIYDNPDPSLTSDPGQVLPGTAPVKYGLWAGNANKDNNVNAGDVGLVKANANVVLTGYSFGDVNLDGTVNAGDVGLTKVSANGTAQTHSSARASNTIKEPKSHVPTN